MGPLMKAYKASLLTCGAILAASASSVSASVDEYSVDANSTVRVNLEVCSPETQLAVSGDTGTDLDFVVSNPNIGVVHTDQATDDYTSAVLQNPGNGCTSFALAVSNLGDKENNFTVILEPVSESSIRVAKYVIQPNQMRTVTFKACGTSAQLTARGDGDTDLDFVIRNSDDGVVHENDDLSDVITAELAGLLSDCETFEMDVSNLGEVYNAMMLVIEPEGVTAPDFAGTAPSTSLATSALPDKPAMAVSEADRSGPGNYRAEANASLTVNVPVCSASRIEVRGDGDTDLDFTVRNAWGDTVHSDFDLTDVTFATLVPGGGECETFTVQVDNLGDVYNVFSISLDETDLSNGPEGSGEYRVNANSSTKIALQVCESTNVFARGDGDTDLDFTITDKDSVTVHSNFDLTDRTEFTLDPRDGCQTYQMAVQNLGNVYNVLTVGFGEAPPIEERADSGENAPVAPPPPIMIAPAPPVESAPPALLVPPPAPPAFRASRSATRVGSGPGEYRADAFSAVTVDLSICELTRLNVNGDGDTDLDFILTNPSGQAVHEDYEYDDTTTTLVSPQSGECEDFVLEVSNLGDVYNVFTVALDAEGRENARAKSAAEGRAEPAQ